MKNIRNLALATLVILSGTWLQAWNCSGCRLERQELEQPIRFPQCRNNYHQYCAGCAVNNRKNNVDSCPQCLAQNPDNGSNVDAAINVGIQSSIHCYNCNSLFNDTDHRVINPECGHRICVSCAYTLLQNRGYSQRTVNSINRRNAPRYDEGFTDHIWAGRHGRRFEHRHRNVLRDQADRRTTQSEHYIAAHCPVCNDGFSQATCNTIHTAYNDHAIGFGQYFLNGLGKNKKEQVIKGVLLGGVIAVYATILYKAYQKDKKANKQITQDPKSNHARSAQHRNHHRKHC